MNYLVSYYDNALIYYPNVFFVALFFISILGIILISIGIIVFGKEMGKTIEGIKCSLSKTRISKESNLKQIKRNEVKKIPFAQMIRIFFERKKISFVYIIRHLTIFFVQMIRVFFIRINTALRHIESQTERIVKKIGKEILIEE